MKRVVVRFRALAAAPLLAVLCLAISAAGAGAAGRPAGMRILAPRPLVPRGATRLGAVSPSAAVSGAVVLQPRDENALTRFISQVTDRHSPLFHHYLNPGAFAARFGPTSSSIAAVESQLRDAGLTVTGVAPDGLLIDFTAPASRVESEFQTGLERYRLANGSTRHARTAPLKVPATIARYVTSVVGLDTTVRLRPMGLPRATRSAKNSSRAAAAPGFSHPAGSPTACADAMQAAQDFGGLTDDQIANAYGAFGLYGAGDTGSGQHIAVYELEPFATSDLRTFDTCYFGTTQATSMLGRVHTINVDGGPGAGPGSGESILDIQDVSAFAPGANIDVYQAPNSTFGSLDLYAKIVNDDVDQIVTTSWGFCEQGLQKGSPGVQQAENVIFEQAAAQGQSVFSAAGDEGSDDCNSFQTTSPVTPVLSVNDPSSQPYVVAAGGTTIDDATQPALEHVWNDGPLGGAAGGGISESWPMPAWQDTPVVQTASNTSAVTAANAFEANDLGQPGYAFCKSDTPIGPVEDGCRELPDVSASADEFTGGITIFVAAFGGWVTIGGTSSAAPMWAGMLADVNASSTCQANNATKKGVGFVNPLLYSVASNPTAYKASFNDITTGNNDAFGDSNLFQATTGYDMASGLGTPQLTQPGGKAGLAFYLCSQAPATTRPTVTNLSPAVALTSAGSTSVTITGTNFEKSGVPNVSKLQLGDVELPAAAFTVNSATQITATFPPASALVPAKDATDGAGLYQVSVTLKDGETSAATANSGFTFVDDNGSAAALPTVTGVHSFTGKEAGGNVVDIYGAGFTGASDVTFGGVSVGAGNFTVVHDWLIQAKVPAFQNGVTSCDEDGSSFDPSQNATNDVCQTQVEVTTPNGTSTDATIKPLYEGAVSFDDNGVIPVPAADELAPAATEYDYVPAPTITSISTTSGPGSLASEEGGSVVTIHGRGLNLGAVQWVNFGDPAQASSQQFFSIVSDTGTEIQIDAPALDSLTVDPTNVPVSVMTSAGLSNQVNATYAGVPMVSGVLATSGPTSGTSAGPDTGGTPIEIDGTGFAGQTTMVTFNDAGAQFSLGTQFNFTAASNAKITTKTVAQNPAVVDTRVCTVTDCSTPSSLTGDTADLFVLFPPGNPKIDSITPASGPATGGTKVMITGENLGCVTNVSFGGVAAQNVSNAVALLDCGSTNTVMVTAPPGKVGAAPVTLETVESDATGAPPAKASFTYTQPPAQTLTVRRSGKGSGRVTSSPSGISCPKTCSHKFTFGASVTLKPKAARGSAFAGWSGECTGKSKCKVTVNETLSATAKFTLKNCVVPKVTGKTLSAAQKALRAHFCSTGKIGHASSKKVKSGRVVSQKPAPGTHLRHNGKVNLTVGKG